MGQGVTCAACGASTPLPDDLTVASFACAYCKATLQTAMYAGASAVSADALLGHIEGVMAAPPGGGEALRAAIAASPRFHQGDDGQRLMPCKGCNAETAVPLDVTVSRFACARCARVWPVAAYISDAERLALDMARQQAGNEALARLYAEGLTCHRCGGHNTLVDDGAVQHPCRYCGAALLLAEAVDASAVARRRLKHGVFAQIDQARAQQAEAERRNTRLALGVAGAVIAVLGLVFALTR